MNTDQEIVMKDIKTSHVIGNQELNITIRQRIVTEAEVEIIGRTTSFGTKIGVVGRSVLNPIDANDKSIGVRIALNRAFQNIEQQNERFRQNGQFSRVFFPLFNPLKEAGKVHVKVGRKFLSQAIQESSKLLMGILGRGPRVPAFIPTPAAQQVDRNLDEFDRTLNPDDPFDSMNPYLRDLPPLDEINRLAIESDNFGEFLRKVSPELVAKTPDFLLKLNRR